MGGVLLIGGLSALVAGAQAQVPVFAAATEQVYVVVSVDQKSGEPVRDLQASDFVIKEDGKPRRITTLVRATDTEGARELEFPVQVTLMLDTSASMRPSIAANTRPRETLPRAEALTCPSSATR